MKDIFSQQTHYTVYYTFYCYYEHDNKVKKVSLLIESQGFPSWEYIISKFYDSLKLQYGNDFNIITVKENDYVRG